MRAAVPCLALLALTLPGGLCLAQLPPTDAPPQPSPVPADAPLPPPPVGPPVTGLRRWLNPSTAPFLPVPEVATDPNGGLTLGFMPVWLRADAQHQIDRIIAPDVLHNESFGWGMHARMYSYPSEDKQWSIVVGIKQRVEREFDLEYQIGRARRDRWSFTGSLISDRDGTPRFFGIGNLTPESDQTNYTAQQQVARAQIGFNISHIWQLAYTFRARWIDILPGTIEDVDSIEQRFGARVLGNDREFLHRISLVYDTRDDLTIPTHGMEWVAYTGAASRSPVFTDPLYTEAGIDGRAFLPVFKDTTLAIHVALRYLLTDHDAPFWALSTIGGGRSDIGGQQPLRGFGAGRFTDKDAYSTTLEVRHRLFSFNAVSTRVDIEVAPFVEAGRVFHDSDTFPISHVHAVGGVGFRGIARPFVVGYVDIGYGSEGSAVFTGINYPF